MSSTFAYKNKLGQYSGEVTIFRNNLKIKKLTSLKNKEQEFKKLLKTEQFATLDGLIDKALGEMETFIKECKDNTEKLRLQNKYNGLNNIKRKIELAKKEYADNPKNHIAYNRLLNLYNSLKNLI